MARKTPVGQTLAFIAVAAAVIVVSILTTLHFSGVPIGRFGSDVGEALGIPYRHATMTDAQLTCEEKLKQVFKNRVRVMHLDSLSTRHEPKVGLYKIFLQADVFADSDQVGPTRETFISCFVHAETGEIERFQFAGDSEGQVGPEGEEPTNYLGL